MSNPFDFEVPTQVAHTITVIEDTFLVPGHRYDILEIYRGNGVETYTYQPALSIPVQDGFVMRYMLDSGKESTMSMAVVPKGDTGAGDGMQTESDAERVEEGPESYSDSDPDCDDCPNNACENCPEDELVDQSVASDAEVDYVSKEDVSEEMSTSEDTEDGDN